MVSSPRQVEHAHRPPSIWAMAFLAVEHTFDYAWSAALPLWPKTATVDGAVTRDPPELPPSANPPTTTYVVLTRDKLGLVIAFAGVTLLAHGVLRPRLPGATDREEPPMLLNCAYSSEACYQKPYFTALDP